MAKVSAKKGARRVISLGNKTSDGGGSFRIIPTKPAIEVPDALIEKIRGQKNGADLLAELDIVMDDQTSKPRRRAAAADEGGEGETGEGVAGAGSDDTEAPTGDQPPGEGDQPPRRRGLLGRRER